MRVEEAAGQLPRPAVVRLARGEELDQVLPVDGVLHRLAPHEDVVDVVTVHERLRDVLGGLEALVEVPAEAVLVPQHGHALVGVHARAVLDPVDDDDVDGYAALLANLAVQEVVVLLALDDEGLPRGLRDVLLEEGRRLLVRGFDLGG